MHIFLTSKKEKTNVMKQKHIVSGNSSLLLLSSLTVLYQDFYTVLRVTFNVCCFAFTRFDEMLNSQQRVTVSWQHIGKRII